MEPSVRGDARGGAGDVLFFSDTFIAAKFGEAQSFFLVFELAMCDVEPPLRAA